MKLELKTITSENNILSKRNRNIIIDDKNNIGVKEHYEIVYSKLIDKKIIINSFKETSLKCNNSSELIDLTEN